MDNVKTIIMAGNEVKEKFNGSNAWLRNDGTSIIYASKCAGIIAGADGVIAVPAGGSAPVFDANGTVYLSGTGAVQLIGSDYSTNPFKASAQCGGSGADEVARAAIEDHAGNAEIHVTAAEKASWNEINYINPNLLDNSDFKINQAGKSVYSEGEKECLDRWVVQADSTGGITVSPLDSGGVRIENTGINVGIRQVICSGVIAEGESYTMSVEIDGTRYSAILNADKNGSVVPYGETPYYSALVYSSAADIWMAYPYVVYTGEYSVELKNAKLEPGTTATPFIAPNAVFENVKIKCSSGIGEYSGIHADTVGGKQAEDFQPETLPTVTQQSAKTYAENYRSGSGDICAEFGWQICGATDAPYENGDFFFKAYKLSDECIRIIAIDINENDIYEIAKINGVWGTWKQI